MEKWSWRSMDEVRKGQMVGGIEGWNDRRKNGADGGEERGINAGPLILIDYLIPV